MEETLRKRYPHELTSGIAEDLGLQESAVRAKANNMGLTKSSSARREYLAFNREKAIANIKSGPENPQYNRVKVTCAYCSNGFMVMPSRLDYRKYCSKECQNKAKSEVRGEDHPLYDSVEVECEHCGDSFTIKRCHYESEDRGRFCSRACVGAYVSSKQGRRSQIEKDVEQVLSKLGIEYEAQKRIGRYVPDFYLPNHGAVIEVDGVYWHSLPEVQERDARKDQAYEDRGLDVARIPGDEIREDASSATTNALEDSVTGF